MAFVFDQFNVWQNLDGLLKAELAIEAKDIRCRPYHGLGHALSEIVVGLIQFWPLKKKIFYQTEGTPFLGELMVSSQRLGVETHSLRRPQNGFNSNEVAQVEEGSLLVVWSRYHGFTGEVFSDESWAQELNKKRICHIEILPTWTLDTAKPPLPFGAQIRVIDSSKAIVLFGSRFRLYWGAAELMDWHADGLVKSLFQFKSQILENKSQVLIFESTLKNWNPTLSEGQGLLPYFEPEAHRFYDRAVFITKGLNGDFFIESLLEKMGEPPLGSPGIEQRAETTNLNRWSGLWPREWWGPSRLTEEQQRTIVALSTSLLNKLDGTELVKEVYSECWEKLNFPHQR